MKIQSISVFTPTFRQKTSQNSQKMHPQNLDTSENSTLDNKRVTHMPSIIFRDNELFDEYNDYVDDGYQQYDDDELFEVPHNDSIDEDYWYARGVTPITVFDSYIPLPPLMPPLDEEVSTTHTVHSLSLLNKLDKPIYSFELNEAIRKKIYGGYPFKTIAAITNASKLKKNIDSERNINSEYVDFALFEKGFELTEKPYIESLDDVTKLMRTSVLYDRNGSEYYSTAMMDFLTTAARNVSVDKLVESAYKVLSYNSDDDAVFNQSKASKVYYNILQTSAKDNKQDT